MGETAGVRRIYSESTGGSPCPPVDVRPCGGRRARLAAVLAGFCGLQGCAMTLPSLWERTNTTPPGTAQMAQTPDPTTTGSIRRPTASAETPTAQGGLPIAQGDWDAAKAKLMEALADAADTPSVPWDNPQSGMSGTVTAMQRANGANGQTCRDFLGSAIKDGREVWFDGRACRTVGPWAVVELRPWRRT